MEVVIRKRDFSNDLVIFLPMKEEKLRSTEENV